MHPEIKLLIEHYHFQPLPVEGIFFVSTYRSTQEFDGGKPFGTAMIDQLGCDDKTSMPDGFAT
jgi:hypothetical protein